MKTFNYLAEEPPSDERIKLAADYGIKLKHLYFFTGATFNMSAEEIILYVQAEGVIVEDPEVALTFIGTIPVGVFEGNWKLHIWDLAPSIGHNMETAPIRKVV